MRKLLIKVNTPKGSSFQLINEFANDELREFCERVGYDYRIVGRKKV